MKMKQAAFALALAQTVLAQTAQQHPVRQDIVDAVRAHPVSWEPIDARSNPLALLSASEAIGLSGYHVEEALAEEAKRRKKRENTPRETLPGLGGNGFPREFDARVEFPHCKHKIRNQFKCGSCWAFSTAETWEDNACILGLNGVDNETVFSTEDLLACATFGSGKCGGGRINYAFDYVTSDGLVDEKCFPYTSQNGTVSSCPAEVGPDQRVCPNKGISWNATKCAGQPNDLFTKDLMKGGIMQLGAVATGYTVYEDFYNYKSGIYRHVTGKMLGGHAIKVVGWGVQNATVNTPEEEYWIVANSWGEKWGMDGYFYFSFNDTDCHFGAGGAYNCGKMSY